MSVKKELLEALGELTILCRGTLLKRTKLCGKSTCPCATDPKARHGPYYEWGRMEKGRLVHTMVSPEQAQVIAEAIRNYRRIQRLLKSWESQSAKMILAEKTRQNQRASN